MQKVLVAIPGDEVWIQEVTAGTKPFRELVGGPLDCIQLGGGFILYCNQDGSMKDLPVNPHFAQGIIKGPFVITKTEQEGKDAGLDEEDVQFVMKTFIRT
ncbi:DUF3846 domain-containing protein [Brevibacillus sp. H7]|uniref:DUF3846 domain-containing protein n=1 Tax=Brevibacillus sp. H7 TaxID=3349138 RepID=UPI003823F003